MAADDGGSGGVQPLTLGFFSAALRDDEHGLDLLGVDGREAISKLFEFDLLLARPGGGPPLTDEQLEELVREPCVIALGPKEGDLVHGILISVEHLDGTRHAMPHYVAKMVPKVALLDLGKRSAIYQQTTVPKMVAEILEAHGLRNGSGFEILVSDPSKSPEREYIVQYQESDWAFIQRWLEHEGYFYWFKHTKKGAVLVIADANDDTTPIVDPETISYRERNNLATGGESTIWDFRVHQRRVPAKVTLVDYNYRRPTDMLVTSETVDEGGFGHVFHYGEHFKDKTVGAAMAKLRAEELLTERRTITGHTDCARFRVGHSFELENHYVGSYDGRYLITAIEHRAGYEVAGSRLPSHQSVSLPLRPYTAHFTALPFDVQYRAPRVTPWPRIRGVISGHVDAGTAGDYAQIDDSGRYKIKLTFDVGTKKGLGSSRWIRMAQSYAGAGYGAHYPLHKGTEVMIAHIDGDPDRPVIVGAVPNTTTPSPVANANATQSVIQTASGIRVEFEDLQG